MMQCRIPSIISSVARWCSLDDSALPPASAVSDSRPDRSFCLSRRLALLALVLVIAGGAALRIGATFSSPTFDFQRPEGLLMSDPALLFYITQRIVDNNGLPPADFRADPRVEHPRPSDLPAMFTVGQEFYLAWGYLLFGKSLPLHVYIVIAMGLFASLAAIGVYGLAGELAGGRGWAVFAALLYAVTLANYRTLGFILIREDFSLPFFAIHLWLFVRALRVRTSAAHAWSGLSLLAAAATWHAMVFIVTLEMASVFAWYLRTGQNSLSGRGAWVMPAVLAAGALAIPVLRAKVFVLSLPMQMLAVLILMAFIERRRPMKPVQRLGAALGAWLVLLALSMGFTPQDYGHVFELMWSKLVYLGIPPEDPNQLSFGARLLWQGPFATASPAHLARQVGALWIFLIPAFIGVGYDWVCGRGAGRVQMVIAFVLLTLFFAVLVSRLIVLVGLVAPVAAAVFLSRFQHPWDRPLGALFLMIQAGILATMLPVMAKTTWYMPEESRNLRRFIDWSRLSLDADGAIACDYVNAPSVLAHTGHSVALQPKYETRASRDRIERFLTAFYHGSPEDLHHLLETWGCRYLLVDVYVMSAMRYQAGLGMGVMPPAGSPALFFLSAREEIYRSVPGFRLLYINGDTPPTWRLYRLE